MAGIFRNGSNLTPIKRTTLSPFCTSPGQLQDVTMDNSYAFNKTSSQHNGSTSPSQGRSVREFEEQMAGLRKENFNLKLRLYFLEEKLPGYSQMNTPEGQESLMKQCIDTKVEVEILRKELSDKQVILKEAAQALTEMENVQRGIVSNNQIAVEKLNCEIQQLEMKNKALEKAVNKQLKDQSVGDSEITGNYSEITDHLLIETNRTHDQEELKIENFEKLSNENENLKTVVAEKMKTIEEIQNQLKQLCIENEQLMEMQANENLSAERLNAEQFKEKNHFDQCFKLKLENDYLNKEVASLKEFIEIERQNVISSKESSQKHEIIITQMQKNKLLDELQDNKRQLADRICMLEDVEDKLKEKSNAHENACKAIQKLMTNIKHQKDEIERLKKLNTSGTKENSASSTSSNLLCRSLSDSEGYVDMSANKIKYQQIIEEKDTEIKRLKMDVKNKTANLQNLVNKELWEKNREIERLTKIVNNSVSSSSIPWSPVKESDQLQKSFSDKEYYTALEQNEKLQKKVDSLMERLIPSETYVEKLKDDVRKATAEAENAEKWRQECSDVCSVLTSRLEELAGFLDSLLKHKDVLGTLALDKRRAIRKAVDRSLDLSRSLNNMTLSLTGMSMIDHSLPQLSNISGLLDLTTTINPNKTFNSHEDLINCETNVIKNLKAEVHALKLELNKRKSNESIKKERRSIQTRLENQSESEAWSEPDRNVSHARMGLEDPKSGGTSNNMKDEDLSTDSEQDINNSLSKLKAIEKVNQLEQILSQRDNRLLEVQCELVDADNRYKEESLRVIEISRKLDDYKQLTAKLQKDIEEMQNTNVVSKEYAALCEQFNLKIQLIETIKEERDKLLISGRVAEIQIETLKADIENIKRNHDMAMELVAEQEQYKLEKLHEELNDQLIEKLKEQEDKHTESLMREWISRTIYEETKNEIEQLRIKLNESQSTIEYLNENEAEMKAHMIENEKAARALKKNLDDVTLQASKAVLERTKALSDKLQLETKVNNLVEQINQYENEKIANLQKITQLENYTQNQIKIYQMNASVQTKNDKLTHGSDATQSGYTSEDVPIGTVRSGGGGSDGGQRLENSSPDLGIESDAGRASSTEISNMQTQLLKTIKISASEMINEATFEIENRSTTATTAAAITYNGNGNGNGNNAIHDCAKVDQENADLRRKLNRTRRAFEDIYNKLRIDNHRKEQVERDIKNQILKTHNVLKNVRSNIENEMK